MSKLYDVILKCWAIKVVVEVALVVTMNMINLMEVIGAVATDSSG